jgi:hypothetical protein
MKGRKPNISALNGALDNHPPSPFPVACYFSGSGSSLTTGPLTTGTFVTVSSQNSRNSSGLALSTVGKPYAPIIIVGMRHRRG